MATYFLHIHMLEPLPHQPRPVPPPPTNPAQLSLLRKPGAQVTTGPQDPQGTQTAGDRSCRLRPKQTATAIVLEAGTGERFTTSSSPGPISSWSWWGLWSLARHSPQPVSWVGKVGGPGEKAGIHLLPLSSQPPPLSMLTQRAHYWWLTDSSLLMGETRCSTNQWLSRATKGP